MGLISLNNLKPGMVLHTDVLEPHGKVLLTAGSTITEKYIGIFRTWGISEADIENVDENELVQAEEAELDPQLLRIAQETGATRFRYNDRKHPAIKKLMELFIKTEAEKLSRGAIKR
jgi:hypothetical protein